MADQADAGSSECKPKRKLCHRSMSGPTQYECVASECMMWVTLKITDGLRVIKEEADCGDKMALRMGAMAQSIAAQSQPVVPLIGQPGGIREQH